jgi:hypothetical protein
VRKSLAAANTFFVAARPRARSSARQRWRVAAARAMQEPAAMRIGWLLLLSVAAPAVARAQARTPFAEPREWALIPGADLPLQDAALAPMAIRMRPIGDGWYAYQAGAVYAEIAPDGTVDIDETPSWYGDREHAHKQALLEATFEERFQMAQQARAAAMSQALVELPAYLEEVWSDGSRPLHERRELLWQLWDECDSALPEGRTARAIIFGYIRKHVIEGT